MRIIRILNNNVVSSLDEKNNEIVVMGKGIGFQKKQGEEIEDAKIEKIFRMPHTNASQFERLVEEMPYEQVKVADEIIGYAKDTLGKKLNKNIYITLTDHLNFALERQKQGITFQNALLWEIERFYNIEFQIGCKAIEIIKERLNVELTKDEAGFFALHIVNAEMDIGDMHQAMEMPGIIKDILNIVKYTFGIEIDENTLSYERFITHLKFFVQRAVTNQCYPTDDEEFVKSQINKFPQAYGCAVRIKEYMQKKMKYDTGEEELMYLTMHISRIVRRKL
ncbi:BglG family transcription antiterminator LicT [[Clostridium] fimetarium]|uniref:Beta-glucoside operon transcriptional antiterminator n=1 Tax=[Clostridium] fimetarium TaxID=99656 RepID=A0A1I0RF94_9FIRM|nr:PRD domain-containing protein [[Clostridium] fimetarium]SEW39546.1 beta-glucoside operon transcriptional antiterminator [[Clostridium] fimetarium]